MTGEIDVHEDVEASSLMFTKSYEVKCEQAWCFQRRDPLVLLISAVGLRRELVHWMQRKSWRKKKEDEMEKKKRI